MSNLVLAADLGGTNLRMAAVDRDGVLQHSTREKTPESRTRDDVVGSIETLARGVLGKLGPNGAPQVLGLAAPAIISSADGRIFNSPNLPELNDFDLAGELSRRLSMPVLLENDANAAAVGENWHGASRGADSAICITLGTGVGGGLIVFGKLLRGIDGTAGEIGHMTVEADGHPCGCGSTGCLEQYASATALVRMARELAEKHPGSSLASHPDLTAAAIYDAGKAGDTVAIEAFRSFGTYLGRTIAGLINVFNPEVVVLGGGAAAGWDLFIGPVRSEIKSRAFREPGERARLVRAALGDDAGIVGSAKLSFEFLDSKR